MRRAQWLALRSQVCQAVEAMQHDVTCRLPKSRDASAISPSGAVRSKRPLQSWTQVVGDSYKDLTMFRQRFVSDLCLVQMIAPKVERQSVLRKGVECVLSASLLHQHMLFALLLMLSPTVSKHNSVPCWRRLRRGHTSWSTSRPRQQGLHLHPSSTQRLRQRRSTFTCIVGVADVRATLHCNVDDSQRHHLVAYQTTREERLAHGVPKDRFKRAVSGVNTFVHESHGLNVTLDAHCAPEDSFFSYNHPERITEVYYAEMDEMFERGIGVAHAHVFHHQLRADTHNADGNGFNTSPASAASYVACCFLPLLQGTQRTSTMCPAAGAQALTMSSLMSWYPCLSGPALHCRVPFSPFVLVCLQKHMSQAFRRFFLDCTCFRRSCCLVEAQHSFNCCVCVCKNKKTIMKVSVFGRAVWCCGCESMGLGVVL